jgi:hypothetical protein
MKDLTVLNNQLLRDFNGDDSSIFVGKVITYALRSGLNSDEFQHLLETLIGASVNCRLNGDRLRYVREVCPLLFDKAHHFANEYVDIEHGFNFANFVRRIVQS